MERSDLEELHYITPITNVASILERGILSHVSAAQIEHDSIADESVQERRSKVRVRGEIKLHRYANLYLNARNSMLYLRARVNCRTDDLCVLRVATAVLDSPGVVITDCNAASGYAQFHGVDSGFAALHKEELFALRWTHTNWAAERRHSSRMQAEVLVPGVIGPEYLIGAYVGSDRAKARLSQVVGRRIPIVRNNYMFFQ